ncbi:unnamed protein product [Prorocentrum cordatum]|uniref:Uncharacterized protein n=1 Tax=Prorocentrum cordatum TaxID=2364126 RepID=A0ABN9WB33_9DINO|nr:unnamed protein product [Polarella glacialis]
MRLRLVADGDVRTRELPGRRWLRPALSSRAAASPKCCEFDDVHRERGAHVAARPLVQPGSDLAGCVLHSVAKKSCAAEVPRTFGVFTQIVQVIIFVEALANLGEAAFVMKPRRGLPPPYKLTGILLFDHILLMSVADSQKVIEECSAQAVEIVQWWSLCSAEGGGGT